jgi:hypothetical protein
MPTLGNQLSAANCFDLAILLLSLLPKGPELTGAAASSPANPATVLDTHAAISHVHSGDAAAVNAITSTYSTSLQHQQKPHKTRNPQHPKYDDDDDDGMRESLNASNWAP